MIDKENLENLRKKLKFRDAGIFEKAVNAFSLLADLLKFYPDLIFKGGTSLLLYAFPPLRFSIDIDILLHKKNQKNLFDNLQKLVAESEVFSLVKEDERESEIPKAHYKFYYDSHFTRDQQYVLLDILFCEHPYCKVVEKKLHTHPLCLKSNNVTVKVPTADGLFGDKMTAISPKTIGIVLNDKREMEFVKQIIDLGMLFNMLSNIEDVRNTFINTIKKENEFRKTRYIKDEVLNDILDIALKYSQHLLKGANGTLKEIERINSGLKRVSNHLVTRYAQSDLKLAFAKIAYMCSLLRGKDKSKIIKDVDYTIIEGKRLAGHYEILEGLKKTNPQAYFYWVLGYGATMF